MKKFSSTHEWIEQEGANATIGISSKAREELGEIVYVELPKVGSRLFAGDQVAVLESTKAAVDVYSPVSGTIIEVNSALKENPDLINTSAESQGWLYKLNLTDPKELSQFMSESDYLKQ